MPQHFAPAVREANRLADATGNTHYVVRSDTPDVDGKYAVATDYDMDTWFCGMSDDRILYCSDDR